MYPSNNGRFTIKKWALTIQIVRELKKKKNYFEPNQYTRRIPTHQYPNEAPLIDLRFVLNMCHVNLAFLQRV